MSLRSDQNRGRPRRRRFVFGTPQDGTAYGRVVADSHTEERWIAIPSESVERIAGTDDLTDTNCVPLRELAPDELPDGATDTDWRQLAVDLQVKTPLTQREADVYVLCRWFGLERGEIATTLDISPNTVDNHLQNVKDIDDEITELVINTIEALDLTDPVLSALPDPD